MIYIDFKKAFDTVSRNFFLHFILPWFWSIISAKDSYILQQYLELCRK